MLDYLPIILGFAAAMLAIGGEKKTNPAGRGLRRLTKSGWAALMLAMVALLTGVATTRRSHLALEAQENQRRILRSIGDTEVRVSLRTITNWFFALFHEDIKKTRLDLVPPHLFDNERIQAVKSIDIRQPVFLSPDYSESWAHILKSGADRGSQELNQAVQIYAPYLDPEVLSLLLELRTSDFLELHLKSLDRYADMNKSEKTLNFYFVKPRGSVQPQAPGYERFWEILSRLDTILEKDKTRLDHAVGTSGGI